MKLRTASCSCGQLTATTRGEPFRISVCHCLACQRRSGSVFAAQARFLVDAVQIQGQASQYSRVGDEGGKCTFSFCPNCGAIVHFAAEGDNTSIAIPVGAFADPTFPTPTVSVYEERMHSWVSMPANIEHIF